FRAPYKPDELDTFMVDLAASVNQLEKLLQNYDRCRFVPVMIAEDLSIRETLTLMAELKRLKIPVQDIIINRVPEYSDCPICGGMRRKQLELLAQYKFLPKGCVLWSAPVFPHEVRGVEMLESFGAKITELSSLRVATDETKTSDKSMSFRVAPPAKPVTADVKLLIFAGKGGVGKTTLASATAMRMAQEYKDKKILLFSIDPAHSVSDCLVTSVGSEPIEVAPGLTALEIDAKAEFDALKKQYAEDLDIFLRTMTPNFDLTFDRVVMERIIDLSPAGLDELMAVMRVMEYLDQGQYDVIILDSAPTGHLLRLLELPEMIDQWLKAFFNLFLKYRRIFQLPKITEILVQMSKQLKVLRRLLKDPNHSAVYVVTIPTMMAFEETSDLVSSCLRMEIATPVLFVNQVTPADGCPVCMARNDDEKKMIRKYADQFPKIQQTILYRRQQNPRGLQDITGLGEALYAPAHNK
ncbi:MAG: TRC40/GET3/ArsA family transport-energizing ATPase, partial [Candidatus Electryoneaceae bacterium]|nr:TRC40/GET3/ArsA family transport-energizing ATPase [Candidatus Electryoneaceae bacterium]